MNLCNSVHSNSIDYGYRFVYCHSTLRASHCFFSAGFALSHCTSAEYFCAYSRGIRTTTDLLTEMSNWKPISFRFICVKYQPRFCKSKKRFLYEEPISWLKNVPPWWRSRFYRRWEEESTARLYSQGTSFFLWSLESSQMLCIPGCSEKSEKISLTQIEA